jgi:histidinol-phosphatase (PHP family)
MEGNCRQALSIGLTAIAFTEHADFPPSPHRGRRDLNLAGYLAELERCRTLFPDLRIMSGIELGEPHRHEEMTRDLLQAGGFERRLGSAHCAEVDGQLLDGSQVGRLRPDQAPDFMRAYFRESLDLAGSDAPFEILTHIDYPKRYWPHGRVPFRETDYEGEYRAVLRALAARDGVLEVNTTRGAAPEVGLCPNQPVLGWWVEEGGRAISLGSDAHEPAGIGRGFAHAEELITALGFRPPTEAMGFWLR